MANKAGKTIDTTFLSIDQAVDRGFLHRDYISHCLRWSHVIKELNRGNRYKQARILDIGCGRLLPLAMALYSSRLSPERYVGWDYGPINADKIESLSKTGKFNGKFVPHVDAAEMSTTERFTDIVCFEVIEHVEPEHCIRMLKNIKQHLADGGNVWLSTPCWNVKDCADNHVNEMKYEALGSTLERLGFAIVNHYGTFASQCDYKKTMNEHEQYVYDVLNKFYDSNVLSTVMGPLVHPSKARNVLWHLTHRTDNALPYLFGQIDDVTEPWTSSDHWKDLASDPSL